MAAADWFNIEAYNWIKKQLGVVDNVYQQPSYNFSIQAPSAQTIQSALEAKLAAATQQYADNYFQGSWKAAYGYYTNYGSGVRAGLVATVDDSYNPHPEIDGYFE